MTVGRTDVRDFAHPQKSSARSPGDESVTRPVISIVVPGYASLATMQLLFSGLIIIGMGIMGEYLGRVFLEVKRRSLYLVENAGGFDSPPPIWDRRLPAGDIPYLTKASMSDSNDNSPDPVPDDRHEPPR